MKFCFPSLLSYPPPPQYNPLPAAQFCPILGLTGDLPSHPDDLPRLQEQGCATLASSIDGGLRAHVHWRLSMALQAMRGAFSCPAYAHQRCSPCSLSPLRQLGIEAHLRRLRCDSPIFFLAHPSHPRLPLRTLPSQVFFHPALSQPAATLGGALLCRLTPPSLQFPFLLQQWSYSDPAIDHFALPDQSSLVADHRVAALRVRHVFQQQIIPAPVLPDA